MSERYRVMSFVLLFALGASMVAAITPAAAQDLEHFERARMLRVLSLLQAEANDTGTRGPAAKLADTAAATGVITGTVEGLDDEGVGSAFVTAWPADSVFLDSGEPADRTYTEARAPVGPDRSFRLEGLAPGPYFVSAMAKGYDTQYYKDADDVASASPVDVPEGGTVEGIDFSLERYNAGDGSIAGTVTNQADGHPIAGAVVHAFAPDNPLLYGMAKSDQDGRYVIQGLRSAQYVVEVWTEEHLPEFYDNAMALDQAVRVEVVEPGQASGIDFGLVVGGSISGTVRDSGGAPVAGAYVIAAAANTTDTVRQTYADEEGRIRPEGSQSWAVTDDNGAYRMSGLTTGEYRVQAQSSARWYHAAVWYTEAQTLDEATPVQVIAGQETPGIDMTLAIPAMDSAISGRITDSQGDPVAGASVTVQQAVDWVHVDSMNADGSVLDDTAVPSPDSGTASNGTAGDTITAGERMVMPSRVWAQASTDEEGRYMVEGLPAGTYVVSAASESGWEYVQRWYVDATSQEDAAELVLNEGERLRDIDIVLPVRTATASISGTVLDQDGAPLARAFVQVSPADGYAPISSVEPARLWAYGRTDSTGAFRVERLPAGTYLVNAAYSTGDRYGQSWFEDADIPEAATPVTLAEGESRVGIDMRLAVRPLYGTVAGTVTDAASGAPVERAYVELSPVDRDVIRSAPLQSWLTSAVTGKSGMFQIEQVPEGTYTLTVYANGASADYVHPDTDALRTPFQVVGGKTTTCDVPLTARHDGDGIITGTVTVVYDDTEIGLPEEQPRDDDTSIVAVEDPTTSVAFPEDAGGAPAVAVVTALPAGSPDSQVRYTAVTEPDGSYAIRGMAPGDYVLMCSAPQYIGVYFDGEYAPDRAQTVHVDGEQPVANIDFELAGMYKYRAFDSDEAGDQTLAPTGEAAGTGAAVYGNVADQSGQPIENATVYVLDANEKPVAFAQTGSDGDFEVAGLTPGQYRVYASRPGFTGSYNGNQRDFAAAEPLNLLGGQLEVDLMLYTGEPTAVSEEADEHSAAPMTMALHRNYPNPFNPQTRITFSVPASGRATLRVHNALGQRVDVLFDQMVEAGRAYGVDFHADGLSAGVYFYTLEFDGRYLTRPMSLVK